MLKGTVRSGLSPPAGRSTSSGPPASGAAPIIAVVLQLTHSRRLCLRGRTREAEAIRHPGEGCRPIHGGDRESGVVFLFPDSRSERTFGKQRGNGSISLHPALI